jgi:hypothetical protein
VLTDKRSVLSYAGQFLATTHNRTKGFADDRDVNMRTGSLNLKDIANRSLAPYQEPLLARDTADALKVPALTSKTYAGFKATKDLDLLRDHGPTIAPAPTHKRSIGCQHTDHVLIHCGVQQAGERERFGNCLKRRTKVPAAGRPFDQAQKRVGTPDE